MSKPRRELTSETNPFDALRALMAAAEDFNSDQTQLVAYDKEERVIAVGVVARGEEAIALAEWLEKRGAK